MKVIIHIFNIENMYNVQLLILQNVQRIKFKELLRRFTKHRKIKKSLNSLVGKQ